MAREMLFWSLHCKSGVEELRFLASLTWNLSKLNPQYGLATPAKRKMRDLMFSPLQFRRSKIVKYYFETWGTSLLIQWRSVTSQKTWVFNRATLRTSISQTNNNVKQIRSKWWTSRKACWVKNPSQYDLFLSRPEFWHRQFQSYKVQLWMLSWTNTITASYVRKLHKSLYIFPPVWLNVVF